MDKTIELVENYVVAITANNNTLGAVLKNIIQQLPVAVIIFDKNLFFLAASDRFFDESPMQKENTHVNDHWYTLVPDMPIKWKAIHQRVLDGEKIACEEDPFYRQDARVFLCLPREICLFQVFLFRGEGWASFSVNLGMMDLSCCV